VNLKIHIAFLKQINHGTSPQRSSRMIQNLSAVQNWNLRLTLWRSSIALWHQRISNYSCFPWVKKESFLHSCNLFCLSYLLWFLWLWNLIYQSFFWWFLWLWIIINLRFIRSSIYELKNKWIGKGRLFYGTIILNIIIENFPFSHFSYHLLLWFYQGARFSLLELLCGLWMTH